MLSPDAGALRFSTPAVSGAGSLAAQAATNALQAASQAAAQAQLTALRASSYRHVPASAPLAHASRVGASLSPYTLTPALPTPP